MKNLKGSFGNKTRDLPTCTAYPQNVSIMFKGVIGNVLAVWASQKGTLVIRRPAKQDLPQELVSYEFNNASSTTTGFYNPLAGFSLLILEVSRSHTVTHHSR
jgi:hypothetical protein